jgi:hypothetical protein
MRDPFDDEDRDWDDDEDDKDEVDDWRSPETADEAEEDGLTFGGMPIPLLWDLMHDDWPGEG